MIPWRRLVAFGSLPFLSALSPLIVIPALTSSLGASGWAALAIGQSIGLFVWVVVGSGWGIVGPPLAARTTASILPSLYRASFTQRLVMMLPASSLGAALAYFLAPIHPAASAAMVPATAVWALGPAWYLTAIGHAPAIAIFDTIPKLTASVMAVVALTLVPSAWTYPAILGGVGTLAIIAASWRYSAGATGWEWQEAMRHMRQQALLVASRMATAGYSTLTVPLVAITAPSAVAAFAAADRLRTFGAVGISAISAGFVGWIYQEGQANGRRQRLAFWCVTCTGVIVAAGMMVLAPLAEQTLFSGTVSMGTANVSVQAVTLVVVSVASTLTFHYLSAWGRQNDVAVAALVGSTVGIPSILLLSYFWGAVGGAGGLLIAELTVTSVLFARFRREADRRRRHNSGRPVCGHHSN